MKTTKRFDNAVTKLYNAFHNGTLEASKCSACAVGNICDNDLNWRFAFSHYVHKDYNGKIQEIYPEQSYSEKKAFFKNGYSGNELHNVEKVFLEKFIGYHETSKEAQFKGLCAVVEYLCELDNIPNVMDYTKLFETEKDKPKYELQCKTQ